LKNDKSIFVVFIDLKKEKEFESLKSGKFQDKMLYNCIEKARADIKKDPICGTKIQKKLWPKEYVKKGINNLFKYNLLEGWRLIYTIKEDDIIILNVILEWFNHKSYEKRFKY
jgi:Txe/YoeB family toxin of Txe-Axe toxin-antitoxin module